MPLIPAHWKQRQADFCKFKSNLVYRVSSTTCRAVNTENPCLEKPRNKEKSNPTNSKALFIKYHVPHYLFSVYNDKVIKLDIFVNISYA